MTKAIIDSKNGSIIVHISEDKTPEELDVIHEAVINAGYKCIIFSEDVDLEFLNSKIIDV